MSDWQNSILTGDVRERLAAIPDNSVDCVVTSPPYWGVRDYQVDDQLGVEEKAAEFVESVVGIVDQLRRVVDGSIWLNLADTYNGNTIIRPDAMGSHTNKGDEQYESQLAENREESGVTRRSSNQFGINRQSRLFIPERIAQRVAESGLLCRDEVIWHKPQPKPEGRVSSRLQRAHEKIYRFATGEDVAFDRDGGHIDDVWTVSTAAGGEHPAPFPPEIPHRAIEMSTQMGDVVLDPFCGSGTTPLAAQRLGRVFVGIELSEMFADMARARIGLAPRDPTNVRDHDDQVGLEAWSDGGDRE